MVMQAIVEDIPTIDNMIQAMSGLSPAGIASIPTTSEELAEDFSGDYKMSVDELTFSDFKYGGQKDFRQDALLRASGSNIAYKSEEERSQASIDNLRDTVELMEEQQEARQRQMEKMYHVGDYQFTGADLQETFDDVLNDPDAFQAKHKLTDKEMDDVTHHILIMNAMSPEDREEYLNRLTETDPKITNTIGQDAYENYVGKRVNKLEKTSFAKDSEIQRAEEIAELASKIESETIVISTDQTSDFALDRPASEITTTFTEEVQGTGPNAQSFVVDEAPQLAQADSAPDPFVLDT